MILSETKERLRLLCLYQDVNLPSTRIRILKMAPYLASLGVECVLHPFPRSLQEWFRLRRNSSTFDGLWLQKKLPSWLTMHGLRLLQLPLIFDYDDAICFRRESRKGSYRSPTRERRFQRTLRQAIAITCGNEYLASLAREKNHPFLIYPSPVPLEVPLRDFAEENSPKRIGWIGGSGNFVSLERIVPALQEVIRRHPFILRVISDRPFVSNGLRVENVKWSLATQEIELAKLDISLMPLNPTSPYDLGKCSYKLLQSMAAGVVVAAEDCGMNHTLIQDGINGRLVAPLGWSSVILELLHKPSSTMTQMASQGRKTVEEHFGYPLQARRIHSFFSSLLCKVHRSPH